MQSFPHLRHRDEQPVWTATGHEPPVFLDEHGRRRRWVLVGGTLAGGASSLWFAALVAGAIGFSTLPSLRSTPLSLRAATPQLAARKAPATREVAAIRAHHRLIVGHRRPIFAQQHRQTLLALMIRPAAGRAPVRGE